MRSPLYLLALLFVFMASPALAQQGFYLPTSTPSYGQDEFRAADGTSCRSTMDGAKHVEVGAYGMGGNNNNDYYYNLPGYAQKGQGNAGVYGKFTYTLDAPTDRMDCNKLYKLEIERRTIELEIMKRSLNAADSRLDALKNERDASAAPPDGPVSRTSLKGGGKSGKGAKTATSEPAVPRGYPPP